MLTFYALVVSGISCLIYCLSIALFVNPEMEEYALIVVLPFLVFIAINIATVFLTSTTLDGLKKQCGSLKPITEEQIEALNNSHYTLTYGLYPLIIASTIIIHLLTMWIEDGGFGFLEDPDSWSLLINRASLFLLVAIIQGNVFDKYLSKFKHEFSLREDKGKKNINLFRRLSWMLVSLSLFLGSSIPIFSTMRFDTLIDQALPSMAVNLNDSEDLRRDIPLLIDLLKLEGQEFVRAQVEFDSTISFLNEQLDLNALDEDSLELIKEVTSSFHERLPLMGAFEEGMDTQNTVSYAFIILTLLVGLIMSFIFSQAYSLQLQLVRLKIGEMLSGDNSVSGRLHITGLDETALLASDFNKILDYNEEVNEDLLRADKVKDAFLANVSHELKTPLHGIIGITESLIDGVAGKLSPLACKNLQLINTSGRRLTSLVNDILDFSKLREHDIVLILKPIDIKTLADVVLEMSKPLLKSQDVVLINNVPKDLPAVEADENRLHQVLLNLVGNAIKFTAKGEIVVSASVVDSCIEICVSDTGIGISPDRQESIFQSFVQGDASISREYGGTGLGLSISRNLIELHGGELGLESAEGCGSRFYFRLPVGEGEKLLMDVSAEPVATYRIDEEDVIEECLDDKNAHSILIVDDEPINLTVLNNHLSLGNYRVIQALDGEEALRLFHQESPDLVLLDVMMPRMSGFELCKEIRKVEPINRLPIIMLTAKDQAQDLAEGFSSGANDYISKPFTKKELLSRIKTHLELSKINRVYSDFVPSEYLSFLGHDSILDVRLGDHIHREMTIMFADIRSYTTMSESMTPQENFDFINEYLAIMGPCIKNNNGFVNHYLGDGLMALFPNSAEDAVAASIDMSKALEKLNQGRMEKRLQAIKVGVGLHYGKVIFGIIGDVFRKSGNVISDDVNISSRLEGLNKCYGSSIIVSQSVLDQLEGIGRTPASRYLGQVIVKGRKNEVPIYELLEVEEAANKQLKLQTQEDFEKGLRQYFAREFGAAADLFRGVLNTNAADGAAKIYLRHCVDNLMSEPSENWSGAVIIAEK
tara:strand:- start:30706 stop:33840 length:3135 start_codon:yes stop_codon:yes gene_type:complete